METKKIEIEIPEGKTAKWLNGVLTLVDEEKPKDIRDIVKTFDDACNVLNQQYRNKTGVSVHPLVEEQCVAQLYLYNAISPDTMAYLKLRIVCAALNEGWYPKFKQDEAWYYPLFYLHTKEQMDKLVESGKCVVGFVDVRDTIKDSDFSVMRGGDYHVARNADILQSFSTRLSLRTKELAQYCGKQFFELWAEYLFGKKLIG